MQANYVFHYPFEATPVFLLDLGKTVAPNTLSTQERNSYSLAGRGGAQPQHRGLLGDLRAPARLSDARRELHQLPQDARAAGVQDGLIHCCAEHSQYDPARGAQVLSGPAKQPLCAVLLAHDAKADTLTAYATLGGELFDEFFRKYEMKLSLDVAPRRRTPWPGRASCGSWSASARTRSNAECRGCRAHPDLPRGFARPVGRGERRSPNRDSPQSFASRSSAASQRLVLLREAEAHHPLVEAVAVERRQRNRRHADLAGEPLAELVFASASLTAEYVHALEVGAFAGQQLEAGARQAFAEQVALALVEGRQLR